MSEIVTLPGPGLEAGRAVAVAGDGLRRPAAIPLSFAQQRLWFLDRLRPDSSTYNMPMAYRLRGALAPAALGAAVDECVRRQESLRTRLATGPEGPVQVIDPAGPRELPLVDLTALPADPRQTEEARILRREALRPFDLERGPLLRTLLVRAGEEDWVILFALHHVISDGWSMGVMLREVATLYDAALADRTSPLAELPVQYSGFAGWQRERLSGKRLARLLAFWREYLAGHPALLDLPTDRPRSAMRTFRGLSEPFALDPASSERLRELSRRSGTSLFITLLAAFKTFLSRITGQRDLLVGTPFAGRSRVELEDLIGFFVNVLVLRTDLSGDPSFIEILGRVRERALAAYNHADVPFEKLVEEFALERSLSHSPIFQVSFALQEGTMTGRPRIGGQELEEVALSTEAAKFDLSAGLADTPWGIQGELHFNLDLFDRTTVRRLARQFATLLGGVAVQPATRLSDLPVLSPAERSALLLEWNDTGVGSKPLGGEGLLAHELFSLQARRRPEAVAVIQGERRLTYGALEGQSNRLALALRERGVGADVMVALLAERTLERVVGIVAVLKAGGAYFSLDPAYPRERLRAMLTDAAAPVVLTETRLLDRLPESAAVTLCLDQDLADLPGEGAQPPAGLVGGDNLAYVIHTSGSTGRPKGVAIPHKGLLNLIHWHQRTYRTSAEDRGTIAVSPSFDPSVMEIWCFLAVGASLVIPDEETRLSALPTLRFWAEQGVTVAYLPTPLAEAVLDAEIPQGLELSLRVLSLGGDRLRRRPRPEAPFRVSNLYGPAEASVNSTEGTVAAAPPGAALGAISIGRPLQGTQAYVLDGDLQLVPQGVAGELYLSGIGLARGYLNRPDLTAERFVPDPWGEVAGEPGRRMYRTGDRVRWLPDGDLDFLGRADHQVKLRGMRVEPGEIEAVLHQHPVVREALVLAVPDRIGEKRLVAYVAPPVSEEELKPLLLSQLPETMVPSAFVFLEQLPLTPNGKVDRRALEELEVKGPSGGEFVPPAGPLESRVAEIWGEVLKLERVGAQDSFWTLGGHSLLAIQVLSRINLAFGVELPLRVLFQAPTVAELARALAEVVQANGATGGIAVDRPARPELAATGAKPALRSPAEEREAPVSFSQQRLWLLDRLLPGTSVYNMPMAYRLHGPLEVGTLAAALSEIERRQGSLRTRFVEGSEGPLQRIAPPRGLALPQVDLTGLPAELRGSEEERIDALEALRPFDLTLGPLLRCLLVRQGEEEWVLLLAMHHIVSDGWSMGVLLGELASLYAAAQGGKPSPLAALPVQYADFAAWQRERLQGRRLEKLLGYWRVQLEGAPPLLDLPLDRPRPTLPTYRGGVEPLHLAARTAAELRQLTRSLGASLFMVTLAGFVAHLRRLSGQFDVVVGTPCAARNRVELEGLIGFFVNTLPLRIRSCGDPTFAQLVETVKEVALGAYANGDLPFERLVQDLAPERALGRTPLFQVSFLMESEALVPLPRMGAVSIEPRPLSIEAAKFDLTLGLAASGEELAGQLGFSRDLFDASTLRRMARQAEILFAAGAADPGRRLSELPLLSAPERSAVLIEWNATASSYPREESLARLFARQVRLRPQAVAVIAAGTGVTYEELDARSSRLARRLREGGVGAESLVALCCERSPEMVVAMLAILRAGGAYLPLDPAHPIERLRYLLDDSGATVALTQPRWADLLPWGSVRRLVLDERVAPWPAAEPSPEEWEEGDGDRLAYVIYTSGSTGRPKGVAVPQRGVSRLVMGSDYLEIGPGLRIAQLANAAFDAATFEIWGPLLNGGTLVILPPEVVLSPAALEAAVADYGIGSMFLTTALFNQLVREAPGLFARLRDLMVGGEALEPSAIRSALADGPPARLLNVYGPTENTTFSTWYRIASLPSEATGVPIGRPVANSRAYVLDAGLNPVPIGVVGALYVAGDGLARGYLRRPDLTAERFVPAPFGEVGGRLYATGDRVRLLRGGEIEFLGRLDHQVKVRGFRVEPGEIEAALGACAGIAEAVVLVRDDETVGKRLVAYVAPPVPEEELRTRLAEQLPEYMVPSVFVGLDRLPVTPNGKIDRQALAALEVRVNAGDDFVAPRTAFESLVAGIWAEVLGLEQVGIHQTFWQLGGHSLLATKVLGRIKRVLGADLPLRSLFKAPTVAEFTVLVGEALLEEAVEA